MREHSRHDGGTALRRRDLLILGGAAAALPLGARAQGAIRRVGILDTAAELPKTRTLLAAFQQRLSDLGWVEGTSVRYDLATILSQGDAAEESLSAARALGVTVPQSLLVQVDQVIE